MRISVHMAAFGRRGEIRPVDVPDDEILATDDPIAGTNILELVYHYGQNEVQDKPHPSVSAGDVVELPDGRLVMCALAGWRAINREQFLAYANEAYPKSQMSSLFIPQLHPLVQPVSEEEMGNE